MSWLFLVLGTAYLFFSLLYDKSGQKDEGRYSYRFGTLVVAWSFIVLLNETFSNQGYLAYLLFILGVAYFFFGVFCEKNNFRKYCQAPYFIGAGVIFFSLSRLASGGTLLKNLTGSAAHYSWDIFNWSSLIIGIVYMFIGWGMEKLKYSQLEESPNFKILFDVIGPLFVLGSILNFGSVGNKPIYETFLLLASLGFIFGSILRSSRSYLYIGTLFLIIYIFGIGYEYFQDKVGWPIILFVAGLFSMGIGVAIEKMRKKYFITNKV